MRWLAERIRGHAPFLAVLLVGLVIWEWAGAAGILETRILPRPTTVVATGVEMIRSGQLVKDMSASLKRVGIGFGLAAVTGMTVGIALATIRWLRQAFLPVVEVLRPIPPIAWIPLAILWFGIGDPPAYFIVFLGAVFPIFVNTFEAMRSVDPVYVAAARTLGADSRTVLLKVRLPAGLPTTITGLRIGLGVGWMAVVAAELIAARSGLGYLIQLSRQTLRTDRVLLGMIAIGLLGQASNLFMLQLERWLVRWRPDQH